MSNYDKLPLIFEKIGMEKVYFNDIDYVIKELLSSACRKIKIAVAWFTNQALFDCLVRNLNKNIEVKILIADDILNRNEFGLDFGELVKLGADVRFANSNEGTMHNKFCVIDDKVITGSYNWTYHANKNNENIIIINETNIVDCYCEQFESLFNVAAPIKMPYEHLKWTDVKEGDFSELRRNIFRDVVAKNDMNTELKRVKLKNLNNAYINGNSEELAKASMLPIEEHYRTITDVLTSRPHDFAFKLWEESKVGKPLDNVDGHIKLCKWIFLPYEIKEENHKQYVKGTLKTYSSRQIMIGRGLDLKVYDEKFVDVIKEFDNKTQGYNWYKDIPENLLCIEYAKIFFHKFPTPLYNNSQDKTWRNGTSRLLDGIDIFGIAKKVDGNNIVFYDGWNPQERGENIQNKFFSR